MVASPARASVAPSRVEPPPPESAPSDHPVPGEDAPTRVASPEPKPVSLSSATTPPAPAGPQPADTRKPQARGVNRGSGAGGKRAAPAAEAGSGVSQARLILEALCSSGGETICGDECVNLANNAAHCGDCGRACSSGQACVAGACRLQCAAGFVDCSGQCVNLANNATQCGVCGRACSSGQACVAGACRLQCATGLVDCGGACVDVMSHPHHCGACGSKCTSFSYSLGDGRCVKGWCYQ
jgi:hypothetical protein